MNKLSIIWLSLLTIAVVALAGILVQDPVFAGSEDEGNGPGKTSRWAYVEADSIYARYGFVQDALDGLQQVELQYNQAFEQKMRKLESRFEELKGQVSQMSPTQLQAAQQELQKSEQELQAWRQEKLMALEERRLTLQQEYFGRIHNFLKSYSEKEGYDLVLGYQDGGQVLYGHPAVNITEEVIAGLENEYQNTGDSTSVDQTEPASEHE